MTESIAFIGFGEAATHLAPGAFWFGLNSCAPSSKRRAAAVIEAAGALCRRRRHVADPS